MRTRESERPEGSPAGRAQPTPAAPLVELLHPRGACASERADVVLVDPSAGRGGSGWAAAVERAAGLVAPDGVVHALPGRRRRGRVSRLLRRRGFAVLPVAYLPSAAHPGYLVPVRRGPLAFALERLGTGAALRRRAGSVLLRLPGGERAVGLLLADVGVVAVRPPAALAAWVQGGARACDEPVVARSWRGADAGRTVFCVAADGEPKLVAKVRRGDGGREADALERLAATAAGAGARVPLLRGRSRCGGHDVVVESAVAGIPAAAVLERRPGSLSAVLDAIARWLLAWNRSTARVEPLDARDLAEWILEPARELSARMGDGAAYEAWLAERCAEVEGSPLARVSAHGDLTMRNVLLGGGDGLGVVDWEGAADRRPPLGDLAYAAVDAADAASGYASRGRAFERCFGHADELGVRARLDRVAAELEVSPAAAQLCLHATWLGHAVDEQRRPAGADGPRQFLGLVELLAAGVAGGRAP